MENRHNHNKIKELEQKIGYAFRDITLLETALRHSSYINEHRGGHLECNERLEFLGDAILEAVSSEYLYLNYPQKQEGELTKMRASLVCEPTLAYDAREIALGDYLMLGKGEEATGGRKRDSLVSDAFEAVIGAIFLDGGFASAKEFVLAHVLDDVERKQLFFDSKTILQEIVQKDRDAVLSYVITKDSGPDHDKSFEAEVRVGDRVIGSGIGKTKKAAEQQAAYNAICRIKNGK